MAPEDQQNLWSTRTGLLPALHSRSRSRSGCSCNLSHSWGLDPIHDWNSICPYTVGRTKKKNKRGRGEWRLTCPLLRNGMWPSLMGVGSFTQETIIVNSLSQSIISDRGPQNITIPPSVTFLFLHIPLFPRLPPPSPTCAQGVTPEPHLPSPGRKWTASRSLSGLRASSGKMRLSGIERIRG